MFLGEKRELGKLGPEVSDGVFTFVTTRTGDVRHVSQGRLRGGVQALKLNNVMSFCEMFGHFELEKERQTPLRSTRQLRKVNVMVGGRTTQPTTNAITNTALN